GVGSGGRRREVDSAVAAQGQAPEGAAAAWVVAAAVVDQNTAPRVRAGERGIDGDVGAASDGEAAAGDDVDTGVQGEARAARDLDRPVDAWVDGLETAAAQVYRRQGARRARDTRDRQSGQRVTGGGRPG